ncbi:hypothetical protein [Bordetella genomosp. 13]|uniref:hypothetical protein n=1 Tax=Bordetella genomosp. 13 TaxID=463040 RepID=UPI0011AAECEE|nr:hypothetical protein [Bordetella genomosp. 13]
MSPDLHTTAPSLAGSESQVAPVRSGMWHRLAAWLRGTQTAAWTAQAEGEILNMDDRMLKDIGAPDHLREQAAGHRARCTRIGLDAHHW